MWVDPHQHQQMLGLEAVSWLEKDVVIRKVQEMIDEIGCLAMVRRVDSSLFAALLWVCGQASVLAYLLLLRHCL